MRVLTVRQPWAWAIIHGGKDVENRVRTLGPYRGPVAIHVALQQDDAGWESPQLVEAWTRQSPLGVFYRPLSPMWAHLGAIIGVVDLVDVHRAGPFEGECYRGHDATEWCSPWAQMGAHHLQLANPRALDEPLPWKGGLGLRKSPLDVYGDALIQRVAGCTCGQSGLAGPHEPMCGFELVAHLRSTS